MPWQASAPDLLMAHDLEWVHCLRPYKQVVEGQMNGRMPEAKQL